MSDPFKIVGPACISFSGGRTSGYMLALIRENPARAVWWAQQEAAVVSAGQFAGDGARFRKDPPSYAQMAAFADAQGEMHPFDEPLDDCACTD